MNAPNYDKKKVELVKHLQEMKLTDEQMDSIFAIVQDMTKAALNDFQAKTKATLEAFINTSI